MGGLWFGEGPDSDVSLAGGDVPSGEVSSVGGTIWGLSRREIRDGAVVKGEV